ncbi:MAG: hypothetical protein R2873_25205 [Caldilineaceae bacterium]
MKLLIITTNFPRWDGDPHSPGWWNCSVYCAQRTADRDPGAVVRRAARSGDPRHAGASLSLRPPAGKPSPTRTAPCQIRRNPLYLLLLPVYVLAGLLASWQVARRTHFDVLHVHWPVPQGLFGLVARAAPVDGARVW